jgi:hypothetical protein
MLFLDVQGMCFDEGKLAEIGDFRWQFAWCATFTPWMSSVRAR